MPSKQVLMHSLGLLVTLVLVSSFFHSTSAASFGNKNRFERAQMLDFEDGQDEDNYEGDGPMILNDRQPRETNVRHPLIFKRETNVRHPLIFKRETNVRHPLIFKRETNVRHPLIFKRETNVRKPLLFKRYALSDNEQITNKYNWYNRRSGRPFTTYY